MLHSRLALSSRQHLWRWGIWPRSWPGPNSSMPSLLWSVASMGLMCLRQIWRCLNLNMSGFSFRASFGKCRPFKTHQVIRSNSNLVHSSILMSQALGSHRQCFVRGPLQPWNFHVHKVSGTSGNWLTTSFHLKVVYICLHRHDNSIHFPFRIFQVGWIRPDSIDSIDSMIWSWKALELGNIAPLSKDDVPGNQVKSHVFSSQMAPWSHCKQRCFE